MNNYHLVAEHFCLEMHVQPLRILRSLLPKPFTFMEQVIIIL